ncbi:MAG: glutamine synthetase family protein [Patescibacteria group bacterium]
MVLEFAKKHSVQFINMQFIDLLGIPKAVTIPVHKLEDAIDTNVWFDGSSIQGFTRIFESDMYLQPDLNTVALLPWTVGSGDVTMRIICDVYLPDGKPFSGDPRGILKRQLAEAKKLGYDFFTGPELEFFLFQKKDGKLSPLPHDNAGYFDQTTDLASSIRADMSFALDSMGVEVEALHHEVAVGQHEIDFKYSDALSTADRAVTFRMVLKTVADRYGLHATFMPKPIFGINGSGMHVHQSMWKGGKNAFYNKKGVYGLSDLARSFIAGQLKHIRAMNAILNPLVNSYKRLVAGYEAPVYTAWGNTNRSALIRIPRITPSRQPTGTRCELRCPDPAANVYLTFAVMLAAGMDGIKNKMTPPDPVEENIFHMDEASARKRKITPVAENLDIALEELKNDSVIRNVLGDDTFEKYYELKRAEWDSYRTAVSQWEIDNYLEVY